LVLENLELYGSQWRLVVECGVERFLALLTDIPQRIVAVRRCNERSSHEAAVGGSAIDPAGLVGALLNSYKESLRKEILLHLGIGSIAWGRLKRVAWGRLKGVYR
jgi:hypothetical protein